MSRIIDRSPAIVLPTSQCWYWSNRPLSKSLILAHYLCRSVQTCSGHPLNRIEMFHQIQSIFPGPHRSTPLFLPPSYAGTPIDPILPRGVIELYWFDPSLLWTRTWILFYAGRYEQADDGNQLFLPSEVNSGNERGRTKIRTSA